jgi:hypothetical protein
MLTAERLRELLDYGPETGVFTWRVTVGRRAKAGAIAGSRHKDGYWQIRIDGKLQLAHRLAWLWMTGEWPESILDHFDTNRANNKWSNLRNATRRLNAENRRDPRRGSASGLIGVSRRGDGWVACITVSGKKHHLGYHRNRWDAHEAYVNAKRRLHEGCTI